MSVKGIIFVMLGLLVSMGGTSWYMANDMQHQREQDRLERARICAQRANTALPGSAAAPASTTVPMTDGTASTGAASKVTCPTTAGNGTQPATPSSASGQQVDPNTGQPIAPASGQQVDPNTGQPIAPAAGQQVDPNTGQPVDPNTGQQQTPTPQPTNAVPAAA